eukprot:GILJ01002809.1.p1 GENE.GILJ01002809.1~~GILJ01002809.1.p1  ORF type:complete len:160 (-),score=35.55 GILJ01002809.1:267-746(-)
MSSVNNNHHHSTQDEEHEDDDFIEVTSDDTQPLNRSHYMTSNDESTEDFVFVEHLHQDQQKQQQQLTVNYTYAADSINFALTKPLLMTALKQIITEQGKMMVMERDIDQFLSDHISNARLTETQERDTHTLSDYQSNVFEPADTASDWSVQNARDLWLA